MNNIMREALDKALASIKRSQEIEQTRKIAWLRMCYGDKFGTEGMDDYNRSLEMADENVAAMLERNRDNTQTPIDD